jgi:Raf kinase inhibitor-like YbhB/YbcL family protein
VFALLAGVVLGASALAKPPLQLTSPVFAEGGDIPRGYTCEGKDASPPLAWAGAPEGTKTFALTVEDPDAPKGTFVHWVLYNVPSSTRSLPEGTRTDTLPRGAMEGLNDAGNLGYKGPCPPSGKHHYVFTLYALNAPLDGLIRPSKAELDRAMRGHVAGQAQLVGMYEKKDK